MLQMLSGLDLAAYAPRLYVVAATDRMSETKARAFEAALAERGTQVLEREVGGRLGMAQGHGDRAALGEGVGR